MLRAVTWRLKLLAARARRRRAAAPDREDVVHRHAAGKSFCDVGCMWKVHGRIAFVAEEAGATSVTGVDLFEATPEFKAERERRGSKVRFVRGDVHERSVVEQVGPHQVVWCSGVLYHSPYPFLTLVRLRELTTELLILQTMAVPELPGAEQGAVFFQGLRNRRLYDLWGDEAHRGFDPPPPGEPYAAWWWGISPSALRAMLRAAGFEPKDQWGDPLGPHLTAVPAGDPPHIL